MAAILGLVLSEVHAQDFFPIGVWFPVGGLSQSSMQVEAIFDDVVAANFNVVHGPLIGDTDRSDGNPSAVQPVTRVQDFLNAAAAKGLRVQLYSWDLPPGLWNETTRMLTLPWDVLDGGRFQHTNYGEDLAERAVVAQAGTHSSGYMLTTSTGRVFTIAARYQYHLFRLSINNINPGSAVVRLQILDSANNVLRQEDITPQMFDANDTYQEFELFNPIHGSQTIRYRVEYLGGRDVRINKISYADRDARDLLRSLMTQYASQGAFRTFDHHLQEVLNDHASFPALWRLAVSDEPSLLTMETTGYVENFFRTSPTNPKPAISAIGNHYDTSVQRSVHEFPRWADPDVMLIDGYPIGDSPQPYTPHTFNPMPGPGDSNYNTELQDRWDRHLLPILQSARDSTRTHEPPIPFWFIAQAHGWAPGLRDPTKEEIRAMVHLALAHGAKGIYYFMYSSHVDGDGVADIDGLVDGTYSTTGNEKWTEVQALNEMLEELTGTLLQLTSDEVFSGDSPEGFVFGLSDPTDLHLGTFTHTDDSRSRYLMVVNELCQPTSTPRTTTVTLDASELDGSDYSYLVKDVYSNESWVTNSGASPSFQVALRPGEGKLFRIEPWENSVTLTGDLRIPSEVMLTLAQGATVMFDPGDDIEGGDDMNLSKLIVQGTLDASAGNITFRSASTNEPSNDWYGIRVESGGTATLTDVTVRDGKHCVKADAGGTLTQTRVTLINCGTAPEVAGRPTAPEFAERSEAAVATYTATDAEGDAVTWSLVAENDADAFAIGSEDGVLRFQTAPDFEALIDAGHATDADGNPVYHVTVRAEDSQQASTEYSVTVTVTNVDEEGTVGLTTLRPQVFGRLKASLEDPDGGVMVDRWTWQGREPDSGTWDDLTVVGTGHSPQSIYRPMIDDVGRILRATVHYRDGQSPGAGTDADKSAQSAETGAVRWGSSAPDLAVFFVEGGLFQFGMSVPFPEPLPVPVEEVIALDNLEFGLCTRSNGQETCEWFAGSEVGQIVSGSALPGTRGTRSVRGRVSSGLTVSATPVAALDNRLDRRTTYWVRVRLVGSGDQRGPASEAVRVLGLGAEGSDGAVALSWDDPGDASITGWEVRYQQGDGAWADVSWESIAGSRATTTSHTVSELTNGTAYWFQVRPTTSEGGGPVSFTVSATPAGVPDPPILSVEAANKLTLRIRLGAANGAPITSTERRIYTLDSTTGDTTWVYSQGGRWFSSSLDPSAAYYSSMFTTGWGTLLSNLSTNVEYTFEVRSVNRAGRSAVARVTYKPDEVELSATGGQRSVRLSWEDPADSDITDWEYNWREGSSGSWDGWTHIAGSHEGTTSHVVSGLKNSTLYEFQVRSKEGIAVGLVSNVASATTLPPEVDLSGVAGNGEVDLSWDYTGDVALTGWQYRRSTDRGATWMPDWTLIAGSTTSTRSFKVGSLSNGQEYTFAVRGLVNGVWKVESDTVSATPAGEPDAPGNLQASAGDAEVTLSWETPSANGAPLTGYQYRQSTDGGTSWLPDWGSISLPAGTAVADFDRHTIKDLSNGVEHTFEVRAVNTVGAGDSSRVTATPAGVPDPPIVSTRLASNGSTLLHIRLGATNGSPITGTERRIYTIDSTTGDTTWVFSPTGGRWNFISIDPTELNHSSRFTDGWNTWISYLTSNVEYTFEVRSVNSVGRSAIARVTHMPGEFVLSASAGDGEVDLSWVYTGNAALTGWEYRRSTDKGRTWMPDWSSIAGSTTSTRSYEVGSLSNGQEYTFAVRGVFNGVWKVESDTVSATPDGVDLSGEAGYEAADLSWVYTGSVALTGWQYRQSTDRGGTWMPDWSSIEGSDGATRSFKVGSLSNGQEYTFAVRGLVNGVWKVESDTVLVTPKGVVELSAEGGQRSARLSWEAVEDPDIDEWEYRQRLGSSGSWDGWTHIAGSHDGTRLHVVGGLKNGTDYEFQVRSKEGSAVGLVSNVAPATTLPPEVDLSGVAGNEAADLSWVYTGSVALTGWQYRRSTDRGATWMPDWTLIAGSTTSTRSFKVGSLSNGQEYTFAVRGLVNGVWKVESDTVLVTPKGVVELSAEGGQRSARLSWEAVEDPDIDEWEYRQRLGSSGSWDGWTHIAGSHDGTRLHVVGGLKNGTDYEFQVRSKEGSAVGLVSNVAPATTLPPEVDLSGVAGNEAADLSWVYTGSVALTGWQYRRSTDRGGTWMPDWTLIAGSTTSTRSFKVGSLSNGQEYTFAVRGLVNGVWKVESDTVLVTPKGVVELSAEGGQRSARLSWEAVEDPDIDEWEYRQRLGSSGSWDGWTHIAGSHDGTRLHVVGGLKNGTDYEFQVRSKEGSAVGLVSNVAPATTLPPEVDLSGVAGNGEVDLSWVYTGSVALTGWQYRRSTDRGGTWMPDWSAIAGSTTSTRSFKVGSLSNGQEYTFAVRGLVNGVWKVESDTVLVTPKGVVELSASVGQRSVTLSWEAVEDPDIDEWEYRQRLGSSGSWDGWTHIAGSHDGTRLHVVGGLKNGTDYEFQVRSKEGSAVGLVSNVAPATTLPPEVDLSGVAGNEAADLSWVYTGSVALTGWQYRRSTDRGATWMPDWTLIAGSTTSTRSFKVGSLSNGQEYTFAVRGVFNGVWKVESDTVLVTPDGVELSASVGQRSVTLSWEDPLDSDITDWEYNRREGSSGSWNGWTHIAGSHEGTTSHEVDGLKNSTDYEFQVRSKEGSAVGLVSNVASATTLPPEVDLSGVAGNGEVDLSWVYTGSVALTGWQYRRSTDRGGTWMPDWSAIAGSTTSTRSFKVGSLSNGQEYTFAVRGVFNGVWKVESDTVLVTPEGVRLSAEGGQRSARLSWEAVEDPDIDDWEYRQRLGSSGSWDGWTHIAGSHDGTRLHVVGGLKNGTDYEFQVRSKEGSAVGLVSNVASATTLPPEVDLSGVAGNEAADLSWVYTGSVALTGWQYRRSTDRGGTWMPDWSAIAGSTTSTRSFKVGSLSNGQEYTFAVRGVFNGVWKVESDTVLVTPEGVRLSAEGGQRSARLSWEAVEDPDIDDWEYRQRLGSSGSWDGWTHIAGSHDGTRLHVVGGLKNGTDYEFQVRSKEGSAVGLVSNVAPATTLPPEVDLSGVAGNEAADLSWVYTGSVALTGWQYRRSTDRGGTWMPDWSAIAGSTTSTRSFKVGSLSNGQEYTFAVRGVVNGVWKVESDTVLVTPEGVRLSAEGGQRSARLSWEAVEDPDIDDWEYRQRLGSSGSWDGWTHIAGSHDGTRLHVVGGLKNGTDYEFQVRSKEGSAVGLVSNVASATTLPPEVDLSGVAGNGEVDLSWVYTGSVALTGWQYRRSTDRGGTWMPDWSAIAGSTTSTRSFKVGSLSNGQEYTFAVRGVFNGVWKVESDTVLVTPEGVRLSAEGGQRSARLSWEAVEDPDIDDWEYRQRLGSSGSWDGWTHIAGSHDGTRLHVVGGLKNGTDYEFQVRSKEGSAVGLVSNVAPATTLPPEVVLSASGGSGSVTLSWEDPIDANIDAWEYRRRQGSSGSWGSWQEIAGSYEGTTSHVVGGLSNSTYYQFQVRAKVGTVAGPASDIASATTLPPEVVLSASGGSGSVTLSWEDPIDANIDAWEYRRRQGSSGSWGSWQEIAGSYEGTTSHVVGGLSNSTYYQFQVRAKVGTVAGPASDIASATTLPPEVVLSASGGSGSVTLSWEDPIDANIDAWEYRRRQGSSGSWGSWQEIAGSYEGTTSHVVGGLSNSTYYQFQVRAKVGTVAGPASDIASATTLPPEVVLSASGGSGSVTLSWEDPIDANIDAWEYRRRQGSSGSWGSWQEIAGSYEGTTSHVVGGLSNSTYYQFQVRAKVGTVAGPASDIASATTLPPEVVLSASGGSGSVTLSWEDPIDANIDAWEYRRRQGSSGSWGSWQEIAGSYEGTTSHVVGGLSNSTYYQFQVRAKVGTVAGPASDIASATTLPPEVVLSASGGSGSVTLSWEDPIDANIDAWEYRRRQGSSGSWGSWQEIAGSYEGTTSHVVGGLSNSTYYQFQVRAKVGTVAGPASDIASATTLPPEVVLSASGGSGSVTLSWEDPIDANIDAWEYRRRQGSSGSWGSWQEIAGSYEGTTSHVVGGLSNSTYYQFQVRAKVGTVAGPASDIASATTLPPEVVLSASGGSGSVTLSWEDPIDANIDAWEYRRRQGSSGSWGSWQEIAGSYEGTTSHVVGGLSNSTYYQFQVRAKVGTVAGPASDIASATTLPPEVVLSASGGSGSVTLSWEDPIDANIDAWEYRRRQGSSGSWGSWQEIAGSYEGTTSHVVGGLSNSTYYQFQVRAKVGTVAGPASDIASATTLPPEVVLSASGGSGSVTLSWEDPIDANIDAWEYRRRQGSSGSWGSWQEIAGSYEGTTSHVVGGLSNSTYYQFQVRAKVGTVAGPASDIASATTLPPKPTGFTATWGNQQVTLRWNNPNDANIDAWEYRQRLGSSGTWGGWKDIAGSHDGTTEHIVRGLTNGTSYSFQVRAKVGTVAGPASDEVSATPYGPPPRPTLTATWGNAKVTVNWGYTSSVPVSKWQVRQGSGSWTDVSSSSRSHTFTNLTNGTRYTFEVRGHNNAGAGSARSVSATPYGPPPRPTLTATWGNAKVTVNWGYTSSVPVSKWQVRQGSGSWTDVSSSSRSHTFTNLTNGTRYTFEVRGHNNAGAGSARSVSATPYGPPPRPDFLTATRGDGKVTLNWDYLSSVPVSQWQVRQGSGSWRGVSSSSRSYTFTNLTNGTRYTFEVRGHNNAGAGSARSVSATPNPLPPPKPAKPTGLSATGGDSQVSLSWDNPNNSTITEWQYRRKAGSGSWGSSRTISGSGASTTSYTVTGLLDLTSYTFQVRAKNASGEGPWSDEESATTTLPFRRSSNHPNPFNAETLLRYAVPETQRVRLTIYDVLGRPVRTLVDEVRPMGVHKVVWDGRDGHGRLVASGIYLYRLQTPKSSHTRKMILLR